MLVLILIFSVCSVNHITEIPNSVYKKSHNTNKAKKTYKSLKMLDTLMIHHAENEVLKI